MATKSTDLAKKADPQAEALALFKSMGMESDGMEQIQSGGITKWVDLREFQTDPNCPREKPVKGNGKGFGGFLLGVQEIEDEDSGEPNADGVKVRHFYTIKLAGPCPVSYKNEEKVEVKEIAQQGEIVAIGERHALRGLRELATDGGVYLIAIQPDSRIKVGNGRTMWTFNMWKRVVKAPAKVTVVSEKPPF